MERKAIAILISPTGERFYEAYGPMVTNKKNAMKFKNKTIALGAAMNRFGRGEQGFWESERKHFKAAYEEYKGWTIEVREI
jgi:hypothetical protein